MALQCDDVEKLSTQSSLVGYSIMSCLSMWHWHLRHMLLGDHITLFYLSPMQLTL